MVSKIFGLLKNTCFSKKKIPVALLSSKSFGAHLDDMLGQFLSFADEPLKQQKNENVTALDQNHTVGFHTRVFNFSSARGFFVGFT